MIEYSHYGMTVASLHDERTGSFQDVIVDDATKAAAIIGPVLDYFPRARATSTRNGDLIFNYLCSNGLSVEWLLDTHPHADLKANVPYGQGKTLSDQQALNVGAYVDSRKRPRDPRQAGSVGDARKAFHAKDN